MSRRRMDRPTGETTSTKVVVHRAGSIGNSHVPVLEIWAGAEMPDNLALGSAGDIFEREGRELADALFHHLPGGTLDQVLIDLMRLRASQLIVSFRRPSDLVRDAAPELLKVAHQALALLVSVSDFSDPNSEAMQLQVALRAAIAKAEGRAS